MGTTDNAKNKAEELKGRGKEAAGSLTDNQDLKNEGSSDKAKGKLGQVVEGLKDDVKEATSNLNDKISEVADKNK